MLHTGTTQFYNSNLSQAGLGGGGRASIRIISAALIQLCIHLMHTILLYQLAGRVVPDYRT